METVRVIYHSEADGWWAESPDVAGWSVTAASYAETVKLVEEGISFALGRQVSLEHCVPGGDGAVVRADQGRRGPAVA